MSEIKNRKILLYISLNHSAGKNLFKKIAFSVARTSVNRAKTKLLYPEMNNYDGIKNESSKAIQILILAKINAKTMLKFVSSTSAVGVRIFFGCRSDNQILLVVDFDDLYRIVKRIFVQNSILVLS